MLPEPLHQWSSISVSKRQGGKEGGREGGIVGGMVVAKLKDCCFFMRCFNDSPFTGEQPKICETVEDFFLNCYLL